MNTIKKITTAGLMVITLMATSLTAFASPGNPGVPAKNGSGRRGTTIAKAVGGGICSGLGRGTGGTAQGLGPGGMMLQDGSCFAAQ